ncbi:MAG: hypothetical protein AAGI11_15090 [Pseudomonadota bacterium]
MSELPDQMTRVVEVAKLMAQELQQIVDEAKKDCDDPYALSWTQALIKDWEEALAESGLEPSWQDVLASQCSDEERLVLCDTPAEES